MTERRHSSTGLLLTEIIFAVLFFSVAAACCLRVFAGASLLNHRSEQLKLEVNSTENLIQQLKTVQVDTTLLKEFYPQEEGLDGGTLFFNEKGEPCEEQEKEYSVQFRAEKKKITADVEIVCYDREEKEIYRLITVLVLEDSYEGKARNSD